MAITAAANAAFLFLATSGIVLWWPKQFTSRFLRPVTWFQQGLSGKARDFNWHNVVGFWSSAVLIVLTFTGMTISYPAVGDLLYRNPQQGPPQQRDREPRAGKSERLTPDHFAGADSWMAAAQRQLPGWTLVTLRLPARPGDAVKFALTDSPSRSPFGRSALTLDATTAAVAKWEPFAGFGLERKLRVAARWAHTGEIGGGIGQLVAGLASAGGTVLVWTGVALAWRRLRAWRRAPAAERSVAGGVIDADPSI
jgi:uncharacterized iron-regulated membrane protein